MFRSDYNNFRYYDPSTGRYITSDPIGLNGGINMYAYTDDNPIDSVDPLGQDTLQIGGAVTGTLGGPFGGQGSAGLVFGPDGVSDYATYGGGLSSGKNEGAGVTVQWSNAQSNSDLSKIFANSSASGGWDAGGTVDWFAGNSKDGPVWGYGFTIGQDTGVSLSVGATYTYVSQPVSYPQFLMMLFLPYIPADFIPPRC